LLVCEIHATVQEQSIANSMNERARYAMLEINLLILAYFGAV